MGPEGLRSELRELFADENAGETLYEQEIEVVGSLIGDQELLERLRNGGISGPERVLRAMVRVKWHSHFRVALREGELDPPSERVLTGIGEVRDRTLTEKGIQELVKRLNLDPQKAIDASKGDGIDDDVKDADEAVGVLIRWYKNRGKSAHKTDVSDDTLFTKLKTAYDEIEKLGGDYAYSTLGGVPAIMADVLSQLGIRSVALFAPYHSDQVAGLYHGRPERLVPAEDGESLEDIASGSPDEPERCSFIAAYNKDSVLMVGKETYTADNSDRAIFRVGDHIGPKLSKMEIELPDELGDLSDPELNKSVAEFGKDDVKWPFFSFFYRWKRENDTLKIYPLGKEGMERIGRMFDYVLLRAPRFDKLTSGDAEAMILARQLGWLADVGARIHAEVSGVPSAEKIDLRAVRACLSGAVRSMGMGDEELMKLVRARGIGAESSPVLQLYLLEDPTEIIKRCQAAIHVAAALALDRLYVHAHDIDLIIRKGVSPAELRAELYADLLAKWSVTLAAVQRRYPNDYRKKLKEVSTAQGAYPLIPYLSAGGFTRLVELFTELGRSLPAPERVSGDELKRTMNGGYWWNRDGGYSVVAVPVMWPEDTFKSIEVNTTGAGDTSSAISAVYAGF